ncbi:rRNA-binding ribosome biosynthesis protein RPF1 [Ascoidea rubescens DSM 1968]|uniref:Putative nucleolar ribosomal biogenesis factor RPF1p n=1 Tax=Ascoidea rubescens DSM 1968 TaxID=1344418 RepID=A0A1D2VD68_9ASCO|nr:putative nucleolar ribosomal biogenesis factor RPF1p [Ascoidea rubescens DSM 1968]ODV59586.1 putative nucleolar ribosomal biogenesis factor RPF1p [Ascoidea rubescens DSM 1968]
MGIEKANHFKIRNKDIRSKINIQRKKEKIQQKREKRKVQKEQNLPKQIPATIESKRVFDETIEKQVEKDNESKEFSSYYEEGFEPKILITSSPKPHKDTYKFIEFFSELFNDITFTKRQSKYSIKEMAKMCIKRDFTYLIVVNEDDNKKKVNGITFIHLPEGPSFYFSLSSFVDGKKISGHGNATNHIPELILNNFQTNLGKKVGRLFQSLFPHTPEFEGRQVLTLHNQRDYIFFRRHRYLFKNEERVGLQELGPQFTLRLRRIQKDIKGDIEWEFKSSMDKDKRKFYL